MIIGTDEAKAKEIGRELANSIIELMQAVRDDPTSDIEACRASIEENANGQILGLFKLIDGQMDKGMDEVINETLDRVADMLAKQDVISGAKAANMVRSLKTE